MLFRIAVKEVLRGRCLDIPVSLRREAEGKTAAARHDESVADVSGELLHGLQGGFPSGRNFDEAAVLLVPDVVLDDNLVAHGHRVAGTDFLEFGDPVIGGRCLVVVHLFHRDFFEESALYGEAVSGRLDVLERSLIRGRQGQDAGVEHLFGSVQDGGDSVDEGRLSVPLLGLFLEHEPDTDAVRDGAGFLDVGIVGGETVLDRAPKQVAEEAVGVGFGLQQSAPGHDGIGVVPAAVPVLDGIFQQGGDVGLDGGFELALGAQGHAPGLGEGHAAVTLQQVLQGLDPAALGEDLPLESAVGALGRRQICLGPLGELLHPFLGRRPHGLHLERYAGVQRPHMEVLRIREPAAPGGTDVSQLIVVQILHGGSDIRNLKAAVTELRKALQEDGRNHRRRTHPFKPAETAVAVAAGEHFPEQVGNVRGRAVQPSGHKADIPGFRQRQNVVSGRFHVRRNRVAHHIQDRNFLQGGSVAGHIHKTAPEFAEKGFPVGPAVQDGRMGLGQRLGGRRHRHGNLHGVGEFVGLEAGFEGHLPGGRCHHAESMREGFPGRYGDGNLLSLVAAQEEEGAGDGLVCDAGNADHGVVYVAFVHEAGLQKGDLHWQRNHHLLLYKGVFHGLVMRVYADIVGGQLVGSAEAQRQRSILRRIQMRLERKGRRELRPGLHRLQFSEGRFFLHHLEGDGFFLHGGIVHEHGLFRRRHGHDVSPAQRFGACDAPDHVLGLVVEVVVVGVACHAPAGTAHGNMFHREVSHVHCGPFVPGNGVQTLVPGGGEGLHAGGGLQ